MDGLRDLYQQVIMDHNRAPRNFERLPPGEADVSIDGHNPLCGDTLTLDLHFSGEGDDATIEGVGWSGVGCAISKSSASLMTEAMKGKTRAEARDLYEQFHHLVTRDAPADEEALGKLRVFAGVGEFPARVKCATLAWRTLAAAIEGETNAVTTET